MSAAPATNANMVTMMSGKSDGLRPPPAAASGFAAGFTAGGAGAARGASTGVSMRVKSLGPMRGAGALDGTGGGAYGSTGSPASFE